MFSCGMEMCKYLQVLDRELKASPRYHFACSVEESGHIIISKKIILTLTNLRFLSFEAIFEVQNSL